MRSFKKIAIISLALTILTFQAAAKDAIFDSEDYSLYVQYNDTACPGDAVYVRMKITQNNRKNKISKEQFRATTAKLTLVNGDKVLRKSDFYEIPTVTSRSRSEITLLSGVPLSSWWTSESQANLKLTVSYNLYGETPLHFDLPFSIVNKEFVSETLYLNESNTTIKTDNSDKRMQQINKLNNLLATVNPSEVHQTTPFAFPTEIERRTSFFADRRIYKYTTGLSSTGLHYGIDFGAPEGTEVRSCAAGKVVMAETRISTGWSIVVEHLPGLYSLYYHLSKMEVHVGDEVEAGQLLGYSGNTGLSTAAHLHWEMRLNGEAVSPDFFLGNFAFEEIEE